jgi:hypothetical protein
MSVGMTGVSVGFTCGGGVSGLYGFIVILKVQEVMVVPQESVAMQKAGISPGVNMVAPLGGVHTTVAGFSEQPPLAVGRL